MSDPYRLTEEQMARLRPYFQESHGKLRVDDRRVLRGIVFVNRAGLRWRDAPRDYGPPTRSTIVGNGGGEMGVFLRMMKDLVAADADPKTVMIDATYLKAHRTASSPRVKKGDLERLIGRTNGGMNMKLHAVADANGRPISFFMTAGQVSDYTGAAASLDDLPKAQWLLGDRGYDGDRFRDAMQAKGIQPCISGRRSRSEPIRYDNRRYRHCSRIEMMFGWLKDWCRVATRYDRCPTVSLSAIAAAVNFWL